MNKPEKEIMKLFQIILCGIAILNIILVRTTAGQSYGEDDENNDFAEFEDFDSDDGFATVSDGSKSKQQPIGKGDVPLGGASNERNSDFQNIYNDNDDDDGIVEEESEFEHFHDEEEFEGFAKPEPSIAPVEAGEPKLTMAKVPLHFR